MNKFNRRFFIRGAAFALASRSPFSLAQSAPATLSIGTYEVPSPSPLSVKNETSPTQSKVGRVLGGAKNLAKKGVEATKQVAGERFAETYLLVTANDAKYYIQGIPVDPTDGSLVDPFKVKQAELRIIVRTQAQHDVDYAALKKMWGEQKKPLEIFPVKPIEKLAAASPVDTLATILDTAHAINGQKLGYEHSVDKNATNGTAGVSAILAVLGVCGSECSVLDNIKGVTVPGVNRGLTKCRDFPVEDTFANLARDGMVAEDLVASFNRMPRLPLRKEPTLIPACVVAPAQ